MYRLHLALLISPLHYDGRHLHTKHNRVWGSIIDFYFGNLLLSDNFRGEKIIWKEELCFSTNMSLQNTCNMWHVFQHPVKLQGHSQRVGNVLLLLAQILILSFCILSCMIFEVLVDAVPGHLLPGMKISVTKYPQQVHYPCICMTQMILEI